MRWDAARRAVRGRSATAGIAVAILKSSLDPDLVLLLPPLVYGQFLVWRQFDFVAPSGYIPYEEARQALAGGDLPGLSGHLLFCR